MLQIIAFALQILAAPTSAHATALPCHWMTADLGKRYNLSKRSRRRACRWEPTLQSAALKNSIDPDLLGALIVVESAWLPWIVSSANACGLTQVIPKWTGGAASGRRKWSCAQLKQPANSIAVGARILRWWIDHHTDKLAKRSLEPAKKKALAIREALCGYNAGFRGCKRAGARYARKVLKFQRALKRSRAALLTKKVAPEGTQNVLPVNN